MHKVNFRALTQQEIEMAKNNKKIDVIPHITIKNTDNALKKPETIASKVHSSLSFLHDVGSDWRLQTISEVLFHASEYIGKFKFVICPNQRHTDIIYFVRIDWQYDFSYGFNDNNYLFSFSFTLDHEVNFSFGEGINIKTRSKNEIINKLCEFFNKEEIKKILKSYVQTANSNYEDSIL